MWYKQSIKKEDAEAFLGTQGYVWDTQSDMFMALLGAIVFVAFFRRWQDVSIERLKTDIKAVL